MTIDDANGDFCDATRTTTTTTTGYDAIDGDANGNVHFSTNLSNWLKAVAWAAILVILLLSTHHSMLLICR